MEYQGFYISHTEDCDENLGGYYCTIHKGNAFSEEEPIDCFCVHTDELAQNPNIDYWKQKYIDEMKCKGEL